MQRRPQLLLPRKQSALQRQLHVQPQCAPTRLLQKRVGRQPQPPPQQQRRVCRRRAGVPRDPAQPLSRPGYRRRRHCRLPPLLRLWQLQPLHPSHLSLPFLVHHQLEDLVQLLPVRRPALPGRLGASVASSWQPTRRFSSLWTFLGPSRAGPRWSTRHSFLPRGPSRTPTRTYIWRTRADCCSFLPRRPLIWMP